MGALRMKGVKQSSSVIRSAGRLPREYRQVGLWQGFRGVTSFRASDGPSDARASPCTSTRRDVSFRVEVKGEHMPTQRIDLPQGTLDLLILRTLALGPQHGWAVSERVQQMSSDVLQIQQGSLYPALHRLERRGWIKARWGMSENNRRAKYYELTRSGHRQLEVEKDAWEKLTAAMAQVLGTV